MVEKNRNYQKQSKQDANDQKYHCHEDTAAESPYATTSATLLSY